MSDRALMLEDFAGLLDDVFVVSEQGAPAIPLILTEAEAAPAGHARPGARPPFSLIFAARDPRVMMQKIYRLQHDGLGAVEIFLVPIGKNADGVQYQAMFN